MQYRDMGTSMGGERVGTRPSSPPEKNIYFVIWWPLCYLFPMLELLCNVFLLMRGLFHHVGTFNFTTFSPLGYPPPPPPPPYESFCERP